MLSCREHDAIKLAAILEHIDHATTMRAAAQRLNRSVAYTRKIAEANARRFSVAKTGKIVSDWIISLVETEATP